MDSDFRRVSPSQKSVKVAEGTPNTETSPVKSFQTPAQAAAADDVQPPADHMHLPLTSSPAHDAKKSGMLNKLKDGFREHKREWLVSAAIVLVCGIILGGLLIKINKHPSVAAQ